MRTKYLQLHRAKVLIASALCLGMVPHLGQANPITTWGYTTDTNFVSATFSGGGGGTQTQTADELSWGATGGNFQTNTGNANTNRSALTIGSGPTGNSRVGGGPVSGSINTTIGPGPINVGIGTSFTHWNNPISSAFSTLTGGLINDTLTLTPTAPAAYVGQPLVNAPTLNFNFSFQETPNFPASGLCANGLAVPATGCPDLFGFNSTTLNNPFLYIDSGVDGILGNGDDFMRTYYASIFILDVNNNTFPIQQLFPGECAAIGKNTGCFGFRTPEEAQTTVQFAFAVTTDPISIPEPGSVSLLGLALVGLAATRRRALSKTTGR